MTNSSCSVVHMPEHSTMTASVVSATMTAEQLAIEEYYRTRQVPKMNAIEKFIDHTSYERVKLRVQYRLPWLVGPPPHLQVHHAATKTKGSITDKCSPSKEQTGGGKWLNNKQRNRRSSSSPKKNKSVASKTATRYIRDVDSDSGDSNTSSRSGWTEATSVVSSNESHPRSGRRASFNLEDGLAALPSIQESEYNSLHDRSVSSSSAGGQHSSTAGGTGTYYDTSFFLSSDKLQILAECLEREHESRAFQKKHSKEYNNNHSSSSMMCDPSLVIGANANHHHHHYVKSQDKVRQFCQEQRTREFSDSSRSLHLLQDEVIYSNPLSIQMLSLQ